MLGSTIAGLAGALVMLEALPVGVVRTCAPASAEDPTVIFVDADAPPGGDGASWLTAFADLQDALEAAVVQAPPIQLWLAEGDYLPTLRLDPDESRSATFVLFDGLEILGGFAGDESDPDERDPGLHVSRLLGDLLGDDAYGHHCPGGTTFTGVDENVFHVMRFETAGAAILDGLTVTGGNAVCICCPLPDLNELPGGGLLIETGTVEVRACVFRGNQAERGGGAISVRDGGAVIATASSFELNAAEGICAEDHGRGGAVLVEGSTFEAFACVFRDNAAQSTEFDGAAGGAVAGMISADLLFEDCVFETNVGTPYIQGAGGGGVAIYDGTLTARRCEFLGNCGDQSGQGILAASSTTLVEDSRFESNGGSNDSFGGAMYVAGGSLAISGSEFISNSAGWAGALFLGGATVTIDGCAFRDNGASLPDMPMGHAIRGHGVDLDIRRSEFSGSHGPYGSGGALGLRDSILHLRDCIFTANSCGFPAPDEPIGSGGAVYLENGAATIVNCVMNRDRAADGGAVYAADTAQVVLVNCTLLGIEPMGDPLEVVFAEAEAAIALHNVIVRSAGATALGGPGALEASFSNVESGWPGSGNFDEDPLFVDPDGPDDIPGTPDDDLRLGPVSPCIDAGDNDAVPPGVSHDLAGNPRFIDDPAVPDSGHGTPPIVDIGAYERVPGDVDGDGVVGVVDLLAVIGSWGACGAPCPADLDGDGSVGYDDLLIVMGSWS